MRNNLSGQRDSERGWRENEPEAFSNSIAVNLSPRQLQGNSCSQKSGKDSNERRTDRSGPQLRCQRVNERVSLTDFTKRNLKPRSTTSNCSQCFMSCIVHTLILSTCNGLWAVARRRFSFTSCHPPSSYWQEKHGLIVRLFVHRYLQYGFAFGSRPVNYLCRSRLRHIFHKPLQQKK